MKAKELGQYEDALLTKPGTYFVTIHTNPFLNQCNFQLDLHVLRRYEFKQL